jgi:hypothetical protein
MKAKEAFIKTRPWAEVAERKFIGKGQCTWSQWNWTSAPELTDAKPWIHQGERTKHALSTKEVEWKQLAEFPQTEERGNALGRARGNYRQRQEQWEKEMQHQAKASNSKW